jgi:hypothetical protein
MADGSMGRLADSPGLRVAELYKEARRAADDNVTRFLRALEAAIEQAREIGVGGEVYPAGVRDVCTRLSEQMAFRAQAIVNIMRPDLAPAFAEPRLGSLEETDLTVELDALGRAGDSPADSFTAGRPKNLANA